MFEKQKAIPEAHTIPDFFIAPNICVYCDGDYWHSMPNQVERDKRQDEVLTAAGYKVYRFLGSAITKDVDACLAQITHPYALHTSGI
jgi:very-short-patch-repair endonuclease